MYERDPPIREYSHEKRRPREAEALQILMKVASAVKPIMKTRGWKVGILTEFFPPEANLLGLNWNRGQKICLRLRYPGDQTQFLPFESVVDTMLHEYAKTLSHIVHDAHDDKFHKLWNELREEHYSYLRKGYTGEGFLGKGRRLGGSSRIPMHEAQRRARAAAAERSNAAMAKSRGSGHLLGGANLRDSGQDMRTLVADAARRRLAITQGCDGSDNPKRKAEIVEEASKNGFRTKAEEDDANERAIMEAYIELIQEEEREKNGQSYFPPNSETPAGTLVEDGRQQKSPPLIHIGDDDAPLEQPPSAKEKSHLAIDGGIWMCGICTLNNPSNFLCCDACGTERPSPSFSSLPSTDTAAAPPVPVSTKPKSSSKPLPSRTERSKEAPTAARLRVKSSYRNLTNLYESESKKPLGWLCHNCQNFMETEWWTCAQCGAMKLSS